MANREIYRREDIRNALNAVLTANLMTIQANTDAASVSFTSGFLTAVQAIASAFALEAEIKDASCCLRQRKARPLMESRTGAGLNPPVEPEDDLVEEELDLWLRHQLRPDPKFGATILVE